MKKILLLVLLVLSLFSRDLKIIKFDYEKAIKIAKEEKKPLIMMLETANCGWCKRMKATTLKDANVVKIINENMIFLRIDRDMDEFPKKFYSRFVPTIFAIDPYKNDEFDMAIGFQKDRIFLEFLESVNYEFKESLK